MPFFQCCSAVFRLLQRSFWYNDVRTAAKRCGSAVSVAQLSENCSATSSFACVRERHGGETRGGRKTSRMTPPKGFGPPLYGTFSIPLRCQCSVFPVQKSTTEQTKSSFGGVQKFSGESVLWYVFLPGTFCTPPYHGPIVECCRGGVWRGGV